MKTSASLTRVLATIAVLLLAAAAFYFFRVSREQGANAHATGMIWIPGGEFTMGNADEKSFRNESPAHRVKVDGFWLGRACRHQADVKGVAF